MGNALFLCAIAKRKGGEGWSKETNVYRWSLTDKMRIQVCPDTKMKNWMWSQRARCALPASCTGMTLKQVLDDDNEELEVESTSAMCAPCLVYRDDIKTSTGQ
jgi:hypothetical protein